MGRPKLVDGTVPTQIRFKARTLGRLHLLLYSDLAQRVPYGRLSEFVDIAVQEKLDRVYQEIGNGIGLEGESGDLEAAGTVGDNHG